jgi:hypothetical protein
VSPISNQVRSDAAAEIFTELRRQLDADGYPPIWLRAIECYGEAMFNDGVASWAATAKDPIGTSKHTDRNRRRIVQPRLPDSELEKRAVRARARAKINS